MVGLTVGPEFGFVVAAAGVAALQVWISGYRFAGKARKVFRSPEFLAKLSSSGLAEEHKKAFGNDNPISKGGYPDMGSGRYSDLLSYRDWYLFNSAQRAHHNYVESSVTTVSLILLSGLFYPRFAAVAGAVHMIGREIYMQGYASGGPAGRTKGALLTTLPLLAMGIAAIVGGLALTGLLGKLPLGPLATYLIPK